MAKRKTVTTTTEEEQVVQPEPASAPISEEEMQHMVPGGAAGMVLDPPDDDLVKFFSDKGEDVTIKVYKYDSATNRPNFRADTDLDGFSEVWLQNNFGPGKYSLRAYRAGNYVGGRTVNIGEGIAKNPSPVPGREIIIPQPAGADPMIQMQLEQMRLDAQTNRELLLKLIDRQSGDGGKSTLTELAEAMAILKTAQPQQESTSPMKLISDALPVIKQLIDMAAGRPEKSDSWVGLARDVVAELPNVISKLPIRQPAAAEQPAPAVVQLNPQPAISAGDIISQLKKGLEYLKKRALKKSDPSDYVNIVLDMAEDWPPEYVDSFLETPYEEFGKLDPDLMDPVYRPWFEKLFQELRNALSELPEPGTPAGEAGDTGNTKGDAGVNSAGMPDGSADPQQSN